MSRSNSSPPERVREPCVIYARYSSHAQRDVSIEQQVADCEAYARQNGLEVVKIYADRALSGTSDKRPQFQQMLRDAAHGRWSYVLTWKVDRFARNRYDSATYKFRLKRHGVRVIYAKECKVNNGSMPLGYCKGPDGRFAIQEAEAEVVREIFRRVAEGEPFVSIANELNGRGVRTKRGGLWGKNSFHRLLVNEMYIGVYSYSDVRVEGGVPAIVDKALFLEVAERLKTKKNPQGRHRENGEYLLTGKLFCGLCGTPMVGISGTGQHGELHYYYVCQKRRLEHACKKANVARDWLEREVVRATLDHVLKPETIQWVADAVMAFQEREENSAVLVGLRDQLSQNKREVDNVLKAIRAGIITASTQRLLVDLEAEGSRLEDAICREEASMAHVERDFIVYWMERFRGGSVEDAAFRRKVIDSFVNAVFLWDDRIRIAFNYSGKGSAVDLALVMDAEAEALAGGGGFVQATPASTNSSRLQGALCSLLLYYHLKFAGPCGKRANRIIRNPPEGGNGLSRSHKFYMSSKSLAASASPRPPNGCTSPSPHCPSRSSSWRTSWDIHCLSVPRGECG